MAPRRDRAEPKWVHRVDRGELLPPVIRGDGTLLVEGFAAREGILEYTEADGTTRREFVSSATLRDSAAGLGRAPVTLQHPDPDQHPSGVTPDTYEELGVGDTDGVVSVEEGGFVRVQIAVRRKDAIEAVQSGTRELSPGYDVLIDPTPGAHPVYGRYDCQQTARRYNHLAIVDKARGGAEVKLRADTAYSTGTITREARIPPVTAHSPPSTGAPPAAGATPPTTGASPRGATVNSRLIPLLTLLGITRRIDTDDAAFDAIDAELRARKDADEEMAAAAEAEKTEEETALETLQASFDALQAQYDALKAKHDEMIAETEAKEEEVEVANLDAVCRAYKIDASKFPKIGDLRKAVATAYKASRGVTLRADASDAYISATVDIAKEEHAASGSHSDGFDPWASTEPPARTDASHQQGRGNVPGALRISPIERARQKRAASARGE